MARALVLLVLLALVTKASAVFNAVTGAGAGLPGAKYAKGGKQALPLPPKQAPLLPKAVPKFRGLPAKAPAAAPEAAAAAPSPGSVAPSLLCTPWSGDLCVPAPGQLGVSRVSVSPEGVGGMQFPLHYLNGIFSLDMQLPQGYSGGVNFAWYTMDTISPSNKDPNHSEIDMEFYGNQTSDIVMLALNVFANGKQNLAQYRLPFDPAGALHTYTIKWGPQQIVWLVDGTPIRVLNRAAEDPWPVHAMEPMSSVWQTPWTPLQPNFNNGPVSAYYGNYKAKGCLAQPDDVQADPIQCPGTWNDLLTPAELAKFNAFKQTYLIVEYGWDNI